MDLPAILHLKVQGERRKRSASLPKIIRTAKSKAWRRSPTFARLHGRIVYIVFVSQDASVSFEHVISSSRSSPLCPAAVQRW